jgi:hypothetical protein
MEFLVTAKKSKCLLPTTMNIWRHELTDLPLSSRAYWYSFASIEFHKTMVRFWITSRRLAAFYITLPVTNLTSWGIIPFLWCHYCDFDYLRYLLPTCSVWCEVTTLAGIFPPITSRSWRLLYSVIDWIRILVSPTSVVTSYQTKG